MANLEARRESDGQGRLLASYWQRNGQLIQCASYRDGHLHGEISTIAMAVSSNGPRITKGGWRGPWCAPVTPAG
jgi:hypothetical protein